MIKQEPICHYCSEPMGDEYFCVVKDGGFIVAHKRCHIKNLVVGSGPGIIIKGGGCAGGTCGL